MPVSTALNTEERLIELSAEAKRWRLRLRAAEARVKELEAKLAATDTTKTDGDTDDETDTTDADETDADTDEGDDEADEADEADDTTDEAEVEPAPDTDALRLENAFMRSVLAHGGSLNTEDAWVLMREHNFLDTVTVSGDGTVEGMDDALARTLDRYPWLSDGADEPDRTPPPPPRSGGRAVKRQDVNQGANKAALSNRFPALKGR